MSWNIIVKIEEDFILKGFMDGYSYWTIYDNVHVKAGESQDSCEMGDPGNEMEDQCNEMLEPEMM
jgi:hypothetical protein